MINGSDDTLDTHTVNTSKPYDQFWDPSRAESPLPYNLVGETGQLTSGAANAANLTLEERRAVQKVIDGLFSAEDEDIAKRAHPDDGKSNPEKGIFAYDIRSSLDRGKATLGRFHHDISSLIGDEKAGILCKSFNPRPVRGGFGRFDVQVEFHSPDSELGGGRWMAKYCYMDPESGTIQLRATASLEAFREQFGEAFSLNDLNLPQP